MKFRPVSRPAPSEATSEALERSWQRAILLSLPIALFSTLLAIPLELLSQQWTPFDLAYGVIILGFVIAEIILFWNWRTLKTITAVLVSSTSVFFCLNFFTRCFLSRMSCWRTSRSPSLFTGCQSFTYFVFWSRACAAGESRPFSQEFFCHLERLCHNVVGAGYVTFITRALGHFVFARSD
jgi:hypothetical protein